ncbi:MAG TPA: hypothetical protein VKV03_18525, partial [Candidatus Binataceae bacterium]|nr:hypothetical protein [Candidatus Binataceae bacterium]
MTTSSAYGDDSMRDAIARMRRDLAPSCPPSSAPASAADALAATFDRWDARDFSDRRAAIAQIAA